MELKELFDSHLALGTEFSVGKLKIRMPTLREIIEFGEKKYFNIVYVFASTSSDYKAQLYEQHIMWEDVSDYEMFLKLFYSLREEDLSILFGDSDTKNFILSRDNKTKQLVYYNSKTDAVIDSTAYEYISGYICAMHNIEKFHEKAMNNSTRRAMIQEAKDNLLLQSKKSYSPQLRNLAIAMANTPEFKADYFHTLDYPIAIFMDCVKQVKYLKHFNYTMHGIYAGTIDAKKIPRKELDWLRKP